MAAWHTEDTEG